MAVLVQRLSCHLETKILSIVSILLLTDGNTNRQHNNVVNSPYFLSVGWPDGRMF
jgi:hypothetical protein